MLESVVPSANGLGKIHLFGAVLLSGALHLVAFLTLGPIDQSSQANRPPFRIDAQLSPRPIFPTVFQESVQSSIGSSSVEVPSTVVQGGAGEVGRDAEQDLGDAKKILRMPSELDRLPVPLSIPELEPEYGFADDAGGRIVINLLIGRDGSVIWLYVESSEAGPSATEYVTQMFRLSRFEAPTFLGVPVVTFTKIEVLIPRLSQ